jgi:hypothetical protein
MRTTPWRRTTLQFLQIFLTDALTFIVFCPLSYAVAFIFPVLYSIPPLPIPPLRCPDAQRIR